MSLPSDFLKINHAFSTLEQVQSQEPTEFINQVKERTYEGRSLAALEQATGWTKYFLSNPKYQKSVHDWHQYLKNKKKANVSV